jgi:hypothetical protein
MGLSPCGLKWAAKIPSQKRRTGPDAQRAAQFPFAKKRHGLKPILPLSRRTHQAAGDRVERHEQKGIGGAGPTLAD